MKKKILAGTVVLGVSAAFWNCTDGGAPIGSVVNNVMNQAVGECSAATEGNVKYAAEIDKYYVCQNGQWNEQAAPATGDSNEPGVIVVPNTNTSGSDQSGNANGGSQDSNGSATQPGGNAVQQPGGNSQQGGNTQPATSSDSQQGGTGDNGSGQQPGGDNQQGGSGDNGSGQQPGGNNQQGGNSSSGCPKVGGGFDAEGSIVWDAGKDQYLECSDGEWATAENQNWVTVSASATQTVVKGKAIEPVVISGVKEFKDYERTNNLYFLQASYDDVLGQVTITGMVPDHFNEGEYTETWTVNNRKVPLKITVAAVPASSSSETVSSSSESGVTSSESAVNSSTSETTSSATVVSSSAAVVTSSAAAVSSSAAAITSSAATSSASAGDQASGGKCIAYTSGMSITKDVCYSSGLNGQVAGKCYKVTDGRNIESWLSNLIVTDAYWWTQVDCGSVAVSSSSSAPKSSASVSSSSSVVRSSSSVIPSSSSVAAVTYTGKLTQSIAYNGTFETIVFSNVMSQPTRGNNALNFLNFSYDSGKKTYTIKAGTNFANAPVGKTEETITVGGKPYTISLTKAAPEVTYTGMLVQTIAYGGSFETIKFSNVYSEPSRGNWSLRYLDFKYDATAKTYTITANNQFASAGAGKTEETITVGGKQYTISVTKQAMPEATVSGGKLTQSIAYNGTFETIVFSNVVAQPTRGNNPLNFLDGTYDAGKKTYTVKANSQFASAAAGTKSETITVNGKQYTISVTKQAAPQSSASVQSSANAIPDGYCYDKRSNKNVKQYTELVGANGEKYAYKDDCSIDCWWDGSNSGCANIFGSGSGNNQPASSSSQVKSSNSTAQSSNSQSTPELSGSCPNIVYANNDAARSGFATRYWDCAKPSCTWKGNAAQGTGASARSCALDGETRIYDTETTSALDGGSATTCKSQAAFTINGCDNMGFAFAAAPNNAACGRCYELTFTGEGKYETKKNHRLLKGKKLIIMASNIGHDVAGEQFDIMIPGGGVGVMNACKNIGFDQGTNVDYGGMLTDCENEVGYGGSDDEIYTKRKSCLQQKCNATFSGDALRGCLFLANFMEAAGNPTHTYREIKCPQVLLDRY